MNENNKSFSKAVRIIIYTVILVLSVYRCFFAIDVDEEYTILISTQIADGYKMFNDVWASHQTSAFFISPFIFVWKLFFGNEYLVLAVRIVSVFIMFGVSLLIEKKLKMIMNEQTAFLIAVFFFLLLPFGTISLSYSLLQMVFVSLSVVYYLLGMFLEEKRSMHFIVSGLFWSGAVLCYPYLAFITPILFIGMILQLKSKSIKGILLFCATCLVCAIIFLSYVFSGVSIEVFKDSVINIFTDPSHSGQYLQERNYFGQLPDIIKKLVVIIATSAGFYLICIFIAKIKKIDLKRYDYLVFFSITPFAAYGILMLLGNTIGFYRSSCMGMSVGFLYFAIVSLMIALLSKEMIQIVCAFLGIAVYLVTFLQGAVGPKDYMGFLYLNVFLCIYQCFWLIFRGESKSLIYIIAYSSFVVCSLSLLYTKGFCVRINGLTPSTTFEDRQRMPFGSLKSIYLPADEVFERTNKERILSENSEEDRTYLLVDTKALLNLSLKGKYIYIGSISLDSDGMSTDPRWIAFIDSPYHSMPDDVLIDKQSFRKETDFLNTKIGSYLISHSNKYYIEELDEYFKMTLE